MEMEILSKEMIRPSSPTPNHLKTYKISLLDQFSSPVYVPMLLFYPPNPNFSIDDHIAIANRSQLLKQSLSKTLDLYYPLAGRAKDSLSIDCNDHGATYISAAVTCNIYEFLKNPDHSVLAKFIPEENNFTPVKVGDPLVMVQETRFSCGGIAMGIAISHMICDATAVSAFIITWAAIARDSKIIAFPDYSKTSLFLQDERVSRDYSGDCLVRIIPKEEKCVTRRFVFDGSVMANLKSIAKSSNVLNPSRVEVVSAVLIRSIVSAMKSAVSILTGANLRSRATPPFEQSCVGNFIWITNFALAEEETDLSCLVTKFREAFTAMNGDLVKRLQGEEGVDLVISALKGSHNSYCVGSNRIVMNSWCNIRLNESADFGWGVPAWIPYVGIAGEALYYTVMLMDARAGNGGIEAWLVLEEKVMEFVENDKEVLSFASLNPSPLL